MKSSYWRGGKRGGKHNECEQQRTQTHTFFHSFVDSSKTQVTSLCVVAEDDGPGHESQPIGGRRSKKQVYTGAFCLLFACITWPRFCVMFTLKDKTWGSFMKSDLCPTFFFFLKINMKVRKRTDSALQHDRLKGRFFFFSGPISSCHAEPPARGTFPTGVRYQIKEN